MYGGSILSAQATKYLTYKRTIVRLYVSVCVWVMDGRPHNYH